MFTLVLCLFIACLLPYLAKIPVAIAMCKLPGGYDNHYPRSQQLSLRDFGARALAAHQNSFESLIIFSTATLTALATDHTSPTLQILAIVYVLSRVVYHVLYLLNWSSLRTVSWTVGTLASFSMIYLCL